MNAAERAVFLGRPEIRHAIRANVDAAPPLSEATKARLAALLAPARRPVASQQPVPSRNDQPSGSTA